MIVPILAAVSLKSVIAYSEIADAELLRACSLKVVKNASSQIDRNILSAQSLRIAGYMNSGGTIDPARDMSYMIIRK